MTTSDFLALVLPGQGHHYFGVLYNAREKGGPPRHYPFTDTEKLARWATRSAHQHDVYFALAQFEHARYEETTASGEVRVRRRTQQNALAARSQWLDLDCGEGKDYETQRAALEALVAFVKRTQLPTPTALVNSGYGVHVYWVFDEDVPRAQWEQSAAALSSVTQHFGFRADRSRTCDIASILRVPGTLNHKRETQRPVQLLGKQGALVDYSAWCAQLDELQRKHEIPLVLPRAAAAPRRARNSELASGLDEFPPTTAERVAQRCIQMRVMRDTLGAGQPEPTWHACLGLLAYCEDGIEHAQEWSSGHEGYSPEGTLAKFNAWLERSTGPTTCARFGLLQPEHCEGCRHRGRITSPIVLGRPDPEHEPDEPRVDQDDLQDEQQESDEAEPGTPDAPRAAQAQMGASTAVPEFPDEIRRDFIWSKDKLLARVSDGEGDSWVPVCDQLPVPEYTFYDEKDATWKLHMRVRVRADHWRQADITTRAVAQGGATLLGELGSAAGVVPKGNGLHLVRYMRTWAEMIQTSTEEVTMHRHFGWQEDGSFLLGDRKYTTNGRVLKVRLTEDIEYMASAHEPQGSAQRVAELIDRAYNRPGHEPYQFTWLAAFASPLLALVHAAPVGIPVIGWSRDSGLGKSTAALAGIAVWGNPHAPNQRAGANKTTDYGITVLAGLRRNLPILLDETTMKDPKWLAQLAYDYSDGLPKIQGKASGGLRDNSTIQWSNMMYMTSNKSVIGVMSSTILDCGPQISRVWEYEYTTRHDQTLSAAEGAALFEELWEHYAVAGDVFLRHIMPRKQAITQAILRMRDKLATLTSMDKSGRFWLLGAACVMVACAITRTLGLHQFDSKALMSWITTHLRGLRQAADSAASNMLEIFADMMSDFAGQFIVTNIEGAKGMQPVVAGELGIPRGRVVGRIITESRRAFVSQAAVREWCLERGVTYRDLERALTEEGWLLRTQRYSIGKGIHPSLGQVRCLWLDLSKFSGELAAVPSGQHEDQEERVA